MGWIEMKKVISVAITSDMTTKNRSGPFLRKRRAYPPGPLAGLLSSFLTAAAI